MSLNYIAFRSNEKFCYYSHFSLKYLTFLIVTSFFLFLVFRSPNSTAFPLILLASLPSLTFGLTLFHSLNIWRSDQGLLFFLYYTLWSLTTHMLFSFRNYSRDTDDFQISIFSPCFSHDLYFQWTDYSIVNWLFYSSINCLTEIQDSIYSELGSSSSFPQRTCNLVITFFSSNGVIMQTVVQIKKEVYLPWFLSLLYYPP